MSLSQTSAQWVQTAGPGGVDVNSVVVADTNVFIGTTLGVYRSADNGSHWSEAGAGLSDPDVLVLAVSSDTAGGRKLFAGTSSGAIYRSTDSGTEWTMIKSGLGHIKAMYTPGANLWVSASGTYLSADGGTSWKRADRGLPGNVTSFTSIGTQVFAAASNYGVFRTTDNGANWALVNGGEPSIMLAWTIAAVGTRLFVGTPLLGMYISTDSGASWRQGTGPNTVYCFAVKGNDLYAGTDHGVWRTSDYGASATDLGDGLGVHDVRALAVSGANLFAGNELGTGVWRSTDDGAVWAKANNGLPDLSVVSAIAVLPGRYISGYPMFAATPMGICLSEDNGARWHLMGLANTHIHSLEESGGSILAGTDDGIFRSADLGRSWLDESTGLSNRAIQFAAGRLPQDIFVSNSQGGVAVTHDLGDSWRESYQGLPGSIVRSIVPLGSYLFAGMENDGVYRSSDTGATWQAANAGIEHEWIGDLALCGDSLVAGGAGGRVFLSSDLGATWRVVDVAMAKSNVQSLVVVPNDSGGQIIFAGTTGSGVFRSVDGGRTWSDVSTGLTNLNVQSLTATLGPYSPLKLIAGTAGSSVWLRLGSEILSVEESGSAIPKVFALEQNYPNPFNPKTLIQYALPQRSHVTLTVFNMLGQQVATLVNGEIDVGYHTVQFDGSNLAGGVYFYRLHADNFAETKKLLLVK